MVRRPTWGDRNATTGIGTAATEEASTLSIPSQWLTTLRGTLGSSCTSVSTHPPSDAIDRPKIVTANIRLILRVSINLPARGLTASHTPVCLAQQMCQPDKIGDCGIRERIVLLSRYADSANFT